MMAHDGTRLPGRSSLVRVLGLVLCLCCLAAASATRAAVVETETGLRVTIHTAEEIQARWLVSEGGRTWLRHPVAGEVELDTAAHPWEQLVPADPELVATIVRSLRGFRGDIAVEIFLLPGFPAGVLSSFARRESVFLAPGLAVQAPETVAYVATHELGHVLCWAALDGRPGRWEAYRSLRELPAQDDPAAVPHAQRHREIIAEDLRFLFGGPLATASGTIENAGLPLPDQVDGLERLLAGFLADPNGDRDQHRASRVYPNPCRDVAVVELDLDATAAKAGAAATVLEIYDVRGRLVRRLQQDRLAGGRATVTWDAHEQDGRRAPAGLYLYRIRHGASRGQGRLTLIDR